MCAHTLMGRRPGEFLVDYRLWANELHSQTEPFANFGCRVVLCCVVLDRVGLWDVSLCGVECCVVLCSVVSFRRLPCGGVL